MPNDFQEELKRTRRNLILLAAIDVIAEHGFARASIHQIAEHAGVSDGTIYNYFENKDAILDAILLQFTNPEKRDLITAEIDKVDFVDFVRDYVPQRMTEIDSGFKALKIVLIEVLTNPVFRESSEQNVYLPLFSVLEAYLQQQMTDGNLSGDKDRSVAARLFASPILGLLLLRLLGDNHVTEHWEIYTNAVIKHLIRGFSE